VAQRWLLAAGWLTDAAHAAPLLLTAAAAAAAQVLPVAGPCMPDNFDIRPCFVLSTGGLALRGPAHAARGAFLVAILDLGVHGAVDVHVRRVSIPTPGAENT
jgi:hypothetical protein